MVTTVYIRRATKSVRAPLIEKTHALACNILNVNLLDSIKQLNCYILKIVFLKYKVVIILC